MGNRAVITTPEKKMGVYLHWNGGRDSVEAFLTYCDMKGYCAPDKDNYGWARLCQVIGNYFGGCDSLGIDTYDNLDTDNGDNGVYIIKDWHIVGREFFYRQEQNNYNLIDMLHEIDSCMPENEQLGGYIDAEEIETSDIQVGDKVYISDFHSGFELHTVVGFGEAESRYEGIPYVDKYGKNGDYSSNPNNYITNKTCKIA